MHRFLLKNLSHVVTRRPRVVALVLVAITALSVWRVSELRINHNQLDLIPQDLPSVIATRREITLAGGVGFLLITLKSNDLDHTKAVADDLVVRLRAMPEIRKVTYKQDIDFVLQRVALYVETPDAEEAYRRIRKKVKSVLRKANPFHVELRKTEEVELDLSDLVEKYRSMNKKVIDDPYYVGMQGEMLLLVVKPSGDSTDLAWVKGLMQAVETMMANYNASNQHGARLVEAYDGVPEGATVAYGYTGGYKRNLDDSETIRAALVPTSVVAFAGILLYLLFFLRRASQIALIMATLLASVTLSFAFCELAIGELNDITAILGAILMGIGIDFGIHFIYRLREEYTRTSDLAGSIETTIEHSGAASLTSALTTSAALYILAFSDFKGFGHFGLVSATGVLITAAMMYTALPVAYILLDSVWPGFKENLVRKKKTAAANDEPGRYPFAKPILMATATLSLILAIFAFYVDFDYDARSLMAADRPSVVLQEEINDRFQISSDPVAIYTETLEQAKGVYEILEARRQLCETPDARRAPCHQLLAEGVEEDALSRSMIDAVISIFKVVPPREQQEANRKILDKLQKLIEPITPDMLNEELAAQYDRLTPYLEAQPFGIDEVPEHIIKQFRPVPESGYTGYRTFVYPRVTLWDGKQLIKFAGEVDKVEVGDTTFYAAGMAVLYADLAQIVLSDGKLLTLLASVAIFLIMLFAFRSMRAALFAMLPLVAGMVWMLGLMTLTGWRINFMNIVVFPVVFGYGISSGVHLFHRYVESGSVMIAVKRTGAAVAASSITTLVGWGALLVSNHRGLTSMGILACFGIASALAVSLTILPSILQVWQDRTGGLRFREPGQPRETA